MKLTYFSIIWALIHIVFGLGLLFFPVQFMSQFGVTLNVTLPSQTLGAVFTGLAVIYYRSRNFPATDYTQHNILLGSFIFHIIEIPIVLMATLNETMNSMGWMPVALHTFLAVTFGYFTFKKSNFQQTVPRTSGK